LSTSGIGRSNIDSRKKKLQDKSPTDEQQDIQVKYQDSIQPHTRFSAWSQSQAVLAVKDRKPQYDIYNKATQNVWYTSKYQRGLSSVAISKLQNIINVVWNMETSDFVKYPVSSSDVSIPTYEHILFIYFFFVI
jgi:hypothetical protein